MGEPTVANWYMLTSLTGLIIVFLIEAPVILLIFTSFLSKPRRKITIPLLLLILLVAIPAIIVFSAFLLGKILGVIIPSR